MSIKGIDSQIMITRAADFARDNSALLKKPETDQDYMTIQAKAFNSMEAKKVEKTQEAELQKLRTDEDGGGNGAAGGGGPGQGKKKQGEEPAGKDHLVPPGEHKIDIKV